MTTEEFRNSLMEVWKGLAREDHTLRIAELERSLDYYKNDCSQKDIKILRLETRLVEIRRLLEGCQDKV